MAARKIDLATEEWVLLSRAFTHLTLKEAIALLRIEGAGKKRGYIMERLYGVVRKRLYEQDLQLLHKGKLPAWLSAL